MPAVHVEQREHLRDRGRLAVGLVPPDRQGAIMVGEASLGGRQEVGPAYGGERLAHVGGTPHRRCHDSSLVVCGTRRRRSAEPRLRACLRLRRLHLTVPGWCAGHQAVQQPLRRGGHFPHRGVEDRLIGLRGPGAPADLAHVLQRGGLDLGLGGRRGEVVQGPDVAAHASRLVAFAVTRESPWHAAVAA